MQLEVRLTQALSPCLAGWPEVTTGCIKKLTDPGRTALLLDVIAFQGKDSIYEWTHLCMENPFSQLCQFSFTVVNTKMIQTATLSMNDTSDFRLFKR